jgi:hypothetical protein
MSAQRRRLDETLKEGGRSIGTGRHWMRRGLVVAEFALALTLLAGGGLAIHSLIKLANVDLGFRSDHLLTFSLPVPHGRLSRNEATLHLKPRVHRRTDQFASQSLWEHDPGRTRTVAGEFRHRPHPGPRSGWNGALRAKQQQSRCVRNDPEYQQQQYDRDVRLEQFVLHRPVAGSRGTTISA